MTYPGIPALERAEAWHLTCPFTNGQWLVQFWDTHEEDRWGKRRMAVAVFQQNPSLPSCYGLVMRSRHFCPAPSIACDGPEAARHVIWFLQLDDVSDDELDVVHADEIGEHFLTMGGQS